MPGKGKQQCKQHCHPVFHQSLPLILKGAVNVPDTRDVSGKTPSTVDMTPFFVSCLSVKIYLRPMASLLSGP